MNDDKMVSNVYISLFLYMFKKFHGWHSIQGVYFKGADMSYEMCADLWEGLGYYLPIVKTVGNVSSP